MKNDGFKTRFISHLQSLGHFEDTFSLTPLEGGRSNTVWQVQQKHSLVLKLYDSKVSNLLFANECSREAAVLRALSGTGLAPELCASGRFEHRDWVLYTYLAGQAWDRNTPEVAQLLGQIHSRTAPSDLPLGCNGSDDLLRSANDILAGCGSQIAKELRALDIQGHVAPIEKTSLIHGDPVPGNIVNSVATLKMIDWQCPANGDPAEDIAMFLSPAMQFLYRGTPLHRAEQQDFLANYPAENIVERYQALRPWFHLRMAAYCIWQAERGNSDYARAFDFEWDDLLRSIQR